MRQCRRELSLRGLRGGWGPGPMAVKWEHFPQRVMPVSDSEPKWGGAAQVDTAGRGHASGAGRRARQEQATQGHLGYPCLRL